MTALKLGSASNNAFNSLAIASVTVFSLIPSVLPIAPGSFPPCPASIATTVLAILNPLTKQANNIIKKRFFKLFILCPNKNLTIKRSNLVIILQALVQSLQFVA